MGSSFVSGGPTRLIHCREANLHTILATQPSVAAAMREDMFKVIVERPRHRGWTTGSTKLRRDRVPDRKRVIGRRLAAETGQRKMLNENLAPLRRYLDRQVGRRWDTVFSEICDRLDTGSTVKMHVREHLDDFVIRTCRRDEDGVLIMLNGGWGGNDPVHTSFQDFYVDPKCGRLKRVADLRRKLGLPVGRAQRWKIRRQEVFGSRAESPSHIRQAGPDRFHVKLNGLWFEITTQKGVYGSASTTLLAKAKTWRGPDDIFDGTILSKRQLGSRELKANMLTNDPAL